MERALLPRLYRALGLHRAALRFCSSRQPAAPSGAEPGAPRGAGRALPASLPHGPGSLPDLPRGHRGPGSPGQSGASRTGRELLRAQQDRGRAQQDKGRAQQDRGRAQQDRGKALRAKAPRAKPPSLQLARGSEVLFGVAPCWLALWRARRALFRLFLKQCPAGSPRLAELALQAAARGVPVLRVSGRELDTLSRGRPHQGACLEAAPLPFRSLRDSEEPRDAERGAQPVWLVLEHIQDPMNLGALLRSAYFLGVDRVVASRGNSCPLTPVVSKASAGAMEVFDVYSTDDVQGFLKAHDGSIGQPLEQPWSKAKSAEGWEVVGTVSRPEDVEDIPVISCSEFQWDKPLIVVIGSEGEGISLESQLQCHRMLAIPPGRALHPGIESLNVSVATGILLHSICSQRRRHGD